MTTVPVDVLKAAEAGQMECLKCSGSGKFYGRPDRNGKRAEGTCFACGGKGNQSPKDIFRNRAYWTANPPNEDTLYY